MMRCMRSTLRLIAQAAFIIAISAAVAPPEVVINGRRTVVVESPAATLLIDLGGGSLVDFHLSGGGLNPLRWLGPGDENAALRPMAHFLCLDRWGQPSAAELRNGMPFHGEASRVEWKELSAPEGRGAKNLAEMSANLPMAGLEIHRSVKLSESAAVFAVSETVTNRNKLGRIYNMVQHATIGPPFLDETTVVDSNAQRGFMQSSPLPNPEQPEIRWPQAIKQGNPVDLRRLTNDPDPNVVSFVLDGEMGWVTATNASKELLLGWLRPYLNNRMLLLDVLRSRSGPPLPIVPSMECLENWPCTRISKSEETEPLLVRAETRALTWPGRRTVMWLLLVWARTGQAEFGGRVRSSEPLEDSRRTSPSARSSLALMLPLDVLASSAPLRPSARMW